MDDFLMLVTISDDTWNVLIVQQNIPKELGQYHTTKIYSQGSKWQLCIGSGNGWVSNK